MVLYRDVFEAYYNCLKNKRSSFGAIKYFMGFEEDLVALTDEINDRTYKISTSNAFVVTDPRHREVFAACFRDRIVHHYVILRLEPLFEEIFGDRTFNCRKEKGVLYGINMLRKDIAECSRNFTSDCWIMKMDLRGFFMSIDKILLRDMLLDFITEHYSGDDKDDILWLTEKIVMHKPEKDCVRHSADELWATLPPNKSLFTNGDGLGLPIGNLSSQHFANFLLHWLDAMIEDEGFKYHGRYVDDFYVIGNDKAALLALVPKIRTFLRDRLRVELHPHKFYIQHYSKGVTFTGAIVKFDRVYPAKRLRGKFYDAITTLNKCKNRESIERQLASVNSYLGQMRHMNSYAIRRAGLMRISKNVWDYVYVKGNFDSVHIRKCAKHRPITKDEYLKVYYARDLNDHELFI